MYMADLVGQIQRDIEKRLAELRPLIAEKEQLEAVLAALKNGTAAAGGGGAVAAAPRAPRTTTTRAAAGRAPYAGGKSRRAPRGANREAILSVVRERPGVSAAEVAAITRIAKPTVHTTISQLKRKGILESEGSGGVKLARGA
jgi:DNA-binding transcriptional ArsR family regulator